MYLSNIKPRDSPPALPPGLPALPGGVSPESMDPSPYIPTVVGVTVMMMFLAIMFTVGRTYANWRMLRWSDYLNIIALSLSLGQGALMFVLANLAYTTHQWDIAITFIQGFVFTVGIGISKASILLLLREIFTLGRPMKIAVWIGLGLDIIVYTMTIPFSVYYNTPRPGETWNDLIMSGRPGQGVWWGVAQAILVLVLDLYIFILPLPILSGLNMSTKRKVKILIVFSTGLVGIATNIVSIVFRFKLMNFFDQTWKLAILLICCVVEANVSIMISSFPGFFRFMRVHLAHWRPVQLFLSKLSSAATSKSKTPSASHSLKDMKPKASSGVVHLSEDPFLLRGSPGASRENPHLTLKHKYTTLNDTWVMKSQIISSAADGDAISPGITKTVDVEQQRGRSVSTPVTEEESGRDSDESPLAKPQPSWGRR
ncbi:hypothetical protein V8F33_007398 [Rhypophila sp. PSN 637]